MPLKEQTELQLARMLAHSDHRGSAPAETILPLKCNPDSGDNASGTGRSEKQKRVTGAHAAVLFQVQ